MQGLPARDVKGDLKGVIPLWLCRMYCWNVIPVEFHTCYLGCFDLHPDFVPRNAPVNTAMKMRDDAKDGQCDRHADEKEPPALQKVSQDAQQRPGKKDGNTYPPDTIAAPV